ncbi:hypothetical protein [Brevibacillus brevis]|uniref:hypothetical protein n=1 Tax=Brevibacillus brevis TaxID=1393 RepID=UPI0037CA57AC
MDKQTLINVLRKLPVLPFEDYGNLVSIADIYSACSTYGLDVREIIELKLLELEKEGTLKVIYMKNPGFEELLVGIKFR